VSEFLEDEDILEMVNSGALEWAVVDDYKARTWAGVFENLTLRNDIVFRTGGQLGHAIRENSPALLAEMNEFLKSHRQGTLKGNILINRYVTGRKMPWALKITSASWKSSIFLKSMASSTGLIT
jgi:membrane-bound lytic murein transglycosylase MltF